MLAWSASVFSSKSAQLPSFACLISFSFTSKLTHAKLAWSAFVELPTILLLRFKVSLIKCHTCLIYMHLRTSQPATHASLFSFFTVTISYWPMLCLLGPCFVFCCYSLQVGQVRSPHDVLFYWPRAHWLNPVCWFSYMLAWLGSCVSLLGEQGIPLSCTCFCYPVLDSVVLHLILAPQVCATLPALLVKTLREKEVSLMFASDE